MMMALAIGAQALACWFAYRLGELRYYDRPDPNNKAYEQTLIGGIIFAAFFATLALTFAFMAGAAK